MRQKKKVMLDVDTGGDDAVALMLAGHHPSLDVVGVTVVAGNSPLKTTVQNTLSALSAAKLDSIPVYPGADNSILGHPIKKLQGQNKKLNLKESQKKPEPLQAIDFLIDYYTKNKEGENTTLIPLAPLTNIALAIKREPRLTKIIPNIVMMGGAYTFGHITPSAEFNIYFDPEAAKIVFNCGIPMTMVGLEITEQARLSIADAEKIISQNTLASIAAGHLIKEEIKWTIKNFGGKTGYIYDACAVASIINPKILSAQKAHVDIELNGELTRGRTVVSFDYKRRNKKPNVLVGTGINNHEFKNILVQGLAGKS